KMPVATSTAERPVLPSALCPVPFALFNVVVWRRLAERAARLLHEIGLDEHVDVTVEHAVHVADLLFRPVIFHQLIRMQHVAADLAAERDLLFCAANLVEL